MEPQKKGRITILETHNKRLRSREVEEIKDALTASVISVVITAVLLFIVALFLNGKVLLGMFVIVVSLVLIVCWVNNGRS